MSIDDRLRAGTYQPNATRARGVTGRLDESNASPAVNTPEARIVRQFNLDDIANVPGTDEPILDAWNEYINALSRANTGVANVRPVGGIALTYFREDVMREAMGEYNPKCAGSRPNTRLLIQGFRSLASKYDDLVARNGAQNYDMIQGDMSENPSNYDKRNDFVRIPWNYLVLPTRRDFTSVEGSNTRHGIALRDGALSVLRDEFNETKSFLLKELGGKRHYNSAIVNAQLDHTRLTVLNSHHSAENVGLKSPMHTKTVKHRNIRAGSMMRPPAAVSLLPPKMLVIDNAPPRG